jgi:sodium transport system permease protein
MRWSVVRLIFRRELLDVLRDRRTLFTMLVIPVILYPALTLGFSQLTMQQVKKLKGRTYQVMIRIGGESVLRDDASPAEPGTLRAAFLDVPQFDLLVVDDPVLGVRDGIIKMAADIPGDLDAAIVLAAESGGTVTISPVYDSTDEGGRTVVQTLERIVQDYRTARLPLVVDSEAKDQASAEAKGGRLFGGMLAMMVILMAMTGAFYPALDVAAGEKERGTLETLLLSPSSRRELVAGKYLTILTVAMVTALMNLGSMTLTFMGFSSMLSGLSVATSFSLSPLAFLVILSGLLIMAGLFSAICLGLSTFARTYKEGQAYMTPAFLIVLPLAMIAMLPDVELDERSALLPVTNVALLMKGILIGKFPWAAIALTLVTLALLTLAALAWTVGLFEREEVLFREGKKLFGLRPPPGVPRPTRPAPQVAILGVLLGLVWFVHIGGFLAGAGLAIQVAAPLMGLAVIALALPKLSMVRLVPGLALGSPVPVGWLAGVLVGVGAVGVSAGLLWLQSLFLGEPDDSAFAPMIEGIREWPLWQTLLIMAVLPGIAEELLFRGLVLQAFRSLSGHRGAVVVSALVFAAFHMNVHRFFPQAGFGLMAGFLVLRTGSLWPAVVAHVVHNSVLILLAEDEPAQTSGSVVSWAIALAVLVPAAFWLVRRGQEGRGEASP